MSNPEYDAIIIGAGIGGLMTAAGLLKAGKKVLILEKGTFIGGKYTELDYKGYKVTTGSWTGMGKHSHIERFCAEVGAKVEYITLNDMKRKGIGEGILGKVRFNNGKEMIPLLSEESDLSTEEMYQFAKVMMGISAKKLPEIDRSKNTSSREFAENFTKSEKVIRLLDSIIGVASGLNAETLPTSEFKVITDEGFGLAFSKFGFCKGGVKGYIDALEKVIKENGGEIRTKTNVKKIIIDDNCASGVELSSGEAIYSNIVVHNAGARRLLTLGGRKNFPSSLIKKIDGLVPIECAAIILGLKKPISKDVPMIFSPDCERVVGLFEPTFFDPSVAPPGRTMIDAFCPFKTNNLKKEIDLAIDDLQNLYPGILDASNVDFQQNMIFRKETPAAECAQTFNQTGNDRIDPKTPVDNLYFVGFDAHGSGVAGDLIPNGVRKALNYILNTEQWLKVSKNIL
ncbi:MAG: NAD(P)/FAD-dependent oxidoreductase [Candidatus Lokiarchaeota archaeon]|nr:NAD(P)/FAD-dependent oxidoreductase [Candidatus Lokiarchaeota archaeon]